MEQLELPLEFAQDSESAYEYPIGYEGAYVDEFVENGYFSR